MLKYTEMLPHTSKPVDHKETRREENTGGCLGLTLVIACCLGAMMGILLAWVILG